MELIIVGFGIGIAILGVVCVVLACWVDTRVCSIYYSERAVNAILNHLGFKLGDARTLEKREVEKK